MQRLALVLALSLAACAGPKTTSGTLSPGVSAAPPERVVCPPEAREAHRDAPLPPSGVGAGALRAALQDISTADTADAFLQWLAIDMPAWGKSEQRRAEALSEWCLKREHSTSP